MRMSMKLLVLLLTTIYLMCCAADSSRPEVRQQSGRLPVYEEAFEVSSGAELGLASSGEGRDTLILLHGFGATSDEWLHFESIAPEGLAKFVAVDLIGHGRSATAGWTDYSVMANASAIARLIVARRFEHPVIVGHSLGGIVALATMRKLDRANPWRPKALVLIATPVYPIPFPRFIAVFRDRSLLGELVALVPSRIKARRALRGLFFDPSKITPSIVTAYARNLEDPATLNGVRMTARQLVLDELDKFASTYAELDLPILVIGGGADRVVPRELLERFVTSVKTARLVIVPECGHLLLDECPAAVERAITPFLRSLD